MLEVVDRNKNRRRPAMDRDCDPLVVIVHAANKFRQVALNFRQRQSRHGQKSD
jgi:hypothetical protein